MDRTQICTFRKTDGQRERQTDTETDRQSDSYISPEISVRVYTLQWAFIIMSVGWCPCKDINPLGTQKTVSLDFDED